jgi:hypothetical protein
MNRINCLGFVIEMVCFQRGKNQFCKYCSDETLTPISPLNTGTCINGPPETRGLHLPVAGGRLSTRIARDGSGRCAWRRICQGCISAARNFILRYRGTRGKRCPRLRTPPPTDCLKCTERLNLTRLSAVRVHSRVTS